MITCYNHFMTNFLFSLAFFFASLFENNKKNLNEPNSYVNLFIFKLF